MAQDKGEIYSLVYDKLAFEELSSLDIFWQDQALSAIESKLLVRPELFGKPLRRTLKGCWALRVGDYRIVYRIDAKTIRILAIIHRSSRYKGIEERI